MFAATAFAAGWGMNELFGGYGRSRWRGGGGVSPSGAPSEAGRWKWKRVAYVTDVEGNIGFFDRWVALSDVVSFDEAGNLQFARDDDAFVFGGDTFDKGVGDIRMSELLVGFKQRHPDRVFLLIGNRDANKLRFATELSPTDLARPAESIPVISAVACRQSLVDFMAKEKLTENDEVARLKWMLARTLGSPGAFEFRRDELQGRRVDGAASTTDAEVVQSFRSSVEPGTGFVHQYLAHGQLAVVLGDVLYVHGAVKAAGMRWIPSLELQYFGRETGDVNPNPPGVFMPESATALDWVDTLNRFAVDALDAYDKSPTRCEWTEHGTRPGDALMAYQSTPATQGRGCVVPSFVNEGGVELPEPQVVAYLNASGIRRMVVGHKPVGDSPFIMRSKDFEVIMADTSFSDTSADDNRGEAVADVTLLIDRPVGSSTATVKGRLQDGRRYDFELPAVQDVGAKPLLVGRPLDDGYWVKTPIADSDEFLLAKTTGHRVTYRTMPADQLERVMASSDDRLGALVCWLGL